MTTTINGLLSVKPGNEPVQGETRTFMIEQRPAKGDKKAWIKVKHAGPDFGGEPYRILSASPTGFVDNHGNISFNVEIEASSSQPTRQQGERVPPFKPDSEDRSEWRESPPARSNGDKLADYAKHSCRVFAAAWEESKNAMALIPQKDAEELTAAEWLDLRLRIASGFSIEINKIIRKERF